MIVRGGGITIFKRARLALPLAALLVAPAMLAQENATLVKRSGERVTGQLIDFGAVGFTMRVDGKARRVRTDEVAIVDFAGAQMSAEDWAKVSDGTHIVWLRNGETVRGQFYDIAGRSPLTITIKTSEGDRELASTEISRIVLARTTEALGTTGAQTRPAVPATGGGIVVPGQQAWTSAGIRVRRGEWVRFNATGEIRLTIDPADMAGAAGSAAGRTAASAPMPNAPIGALIGRVGNSQPFLIGDQTRVQMTAAGVLFLGINDDHLADNAGEFRVQVTGGTVR